MYRNAGIFALIIFFAMVVVGAVAITFTDAKSNTEVNEQVNGTYSFPSPSADSSTPKPTVTPKPTITPKPTETPTAKPEKKLVTVDNYYEFFEQPDDPLLLLVNTFIPLPDDYEMTPMLYNGETVSSVIYDSLSKMLDDAKNEGLELWVASGYRSIEEQTELLEEGIANRMYEFGYTHEQAEENALMGFSKPGYSEHHTGLSVDFNYVNSDFEDTEEYEWLKENAWKYGFIQRYPKDKTEITKIKYEPWHYRYVGVENAKAIGSKNYCLEEYIIYLKNK